MLISTDTLGLNIRRNEKSALDRRTHLVADVTYFSAREDHPRRSASWDQVETLKAHGRPRLNCYIMLRSLFDGSSWRGYQPPFSSLENLVKG